MKLSIQETKKLYDFILKNRNILLIDNNLFSNDTLTLLMNIIEENRPNDYNLSNEQEEVLIKVFIAGNFVFDDNTPHFILTNTKCIDAAIERDINSVNYITNFTPDLERKALNLAIKNNYILRINSPIFLKSNYHVAINSIMQDSSSIDYINWSAMSKENSDTLINKAIEQGYVLSSHSCDLLKSNPDVIISSLSKDKKLLNYASIVARDNFKVFKYLILNGYQFSDSDLKLRSLSNYTDIDVMKHFFNHFLINNTSNIEELFDDYPNEIGKYIDRFSNLFSNAIKTNPTISSFKDIFEFSAEVDWEEYKIENIDYYANLLGKICVELQTNADFDDAIDNLYFLDNMEEELDNRYNILFQAMQEYHKIIHSKQGLFNIDNARNKIAELSALYVSISKENFKKEQLKKYQEMLIDYFISRKNHQVIYKKIIGDRKKSAIRVLYMR